MKRINLVAGCSIFFLAAALSSNAQQVLKPEIKTATEPAAKPTASQPEAKLQDAPKPSAATFQKSTELSKSAAIDQPATTADQKPAEVKAVSSQPGTAAQDMSKTKTITITPGTKERPLAKEGPQTPDRQQ